MQNISINDSTYQVKDSWQDMTIQDAINLMEVIDEMPGTMSDMYGSLRDEKRLAEIIETITEEEQVKVFPEFYGKVISTLSDVPPKVMDKVNWSDRTVYYRTYLEKLVIGLIQYPYDYSVEEIDSFDFEEVQYKLPNRTDKFGNFSPMAGEDTITFTESADLELYTRNLIKGKYDYATNIISIICRPEGERYDESVSLDRAKRFKELPMSIYWEVFFCLQKRLKSLEENILTYSKELVSKGVKEQRSQGLRSLGGMLRLFRLQRVESLTKVN